MGRIRSGREDGFTLVELLVVVIVIGVLAAIAIPVFTGQKVRAVEATVQSDLRNLAAGAETYFAGQLDYPDVADDFASGHVPNITQNNTFVAFTDDRGYVIYGTAPNSSKVFVLSSYDGGDPRPAVGLTALPSTGPAAGTLGALQPDLTAAAPVPVP